MVQDTKTFVPTAQVPRIDRSCLRTMVLIMLIAQTLLVTTPWLAEEGGMEQLLQQIAQRFCVIPTGLSSGLRFHHSDQALLRDYERGFIKEGVGAGAFTLLAQLRGYSRQQLLQECENAVRQLKGAAASTPTSSTI